MSVEENQWGKEMTPERLVEWLTEIKGWLGRSTWKYAILLVKKYGLGPYAVRQLFIELPDSSDNKTERVEMLVGLGHLVRSGFLKGNAWGFEWSSEAHQAFGKAHTEEILPTSEDHGDQLDIDDTAVRGID